MHCTQILHDIDFQRTTVTVAAAATADDNDNLGYFCVLQYMYLAQECTQGSGAVLSLVSRSSESSLSSYRDEKYTRLKGLSLIHI